MQTRPEATRLSHDLDNSFQSHDDDEDDEEVFAEQIATMHSHDLRKVIRTTHLSLSE